MCVSAQLCTVVEGYIYILVYWGVCIRIRMHRRVRLRTGLNMGAHTYMYVSMRRCIWL